MRYIYKLTSSDVVVSPGALIYLYYTTGVTHARSTDVSNQPHTTRILMCKSIQPHIIGLVSRQDSQLVVVVVNRDHLTPVAQYITIEAWVRSGYGFWRRNFLYTGGSGYRRFQQVKSSRTSRTCYCYTDPGGSPHLRDAQVQPGLLALIVRSELVARRVVDI